MNHSRAIVTFSVLNLSMLVLSVISYYVFPDTALAFVPFFFTLIMIMFAPLSAGPGVILTYVAFDGMLKILSNYNPLIHVGADLLVMALIFRWLVALRFAPSLSKTGTPPFFILFLMHLTWIVVQILNPYGLGLIPSIAGFKVYVTFITLYFAAYFSVDNVEELEALIWVALMILAGEVVLSAVQFQYGERSVLALSPNYSKAMHDTFIGSYFRPFGTSSNPGAVSAWCYLTLPLLVGYALVEASVMRRLLCAALGMGTIYVMFVSQVRASFIKAVAGAVAVYVFSYLRRPIVLVAGGVAGAGVMAGLASLLMLNIPGLEIARQRFAALGNFDFIITARGHGVWQSVMYIWENAPFGLGLSRVGAASGVFKNEIMANPFFGLDWSFADNLYRALTIEIGIPGSLLYLGMLFAPLFFVCRRLVLLPMAPDRRRFLVSGCAGVAVASVAGHWGTEASLYLPECAYYWIFLGAAVRLSEVPSQQEHNS